MKLYIRYLSVFVLAALVCLPAKADVFDEIRKKDGFVPYDVIDKLAKEASFICYKFDDVTKTCEARAKYITWWFKAAFEVTFPISASGTITATIIFQDEEFKGPDGFYCGRAENGEIKSIEFDVPWKHRSDQILLTDLDKMKAEILAGDRKHSGECSAHFYSGASFKIESYALDGKQLPSTGYDYAKISNVKYKLRLPRK